MAADDDVSIEMGDLLSPQAFAELLGGQGGPNSGPSLQELLGGLGDPNSGPSLHELLGGLGDPNSMPPLHELLGGLGDPNSGPPLQELLGGLRRGLAGPNRISDIGGELNLKPLHRACLMNNSDQVAKLLQNKTVDICAPDKNRSTPLHLACQFGYKEIVELLIEERANRLKSALHENDVDSKIKSFFNLTDNHENIPLGLACIGGHTEIVELLLEQDGAVINHTNSQKRTPLGMACIQGHTEIVELLLKRRANVNVTDENRLTPLGNASIPGHTEVVKLLLEHGANVNVTDKNGNTPLGNASIPGHTKIVKLLLEHGVANVDHPDKDNDTPLGMACVGGYKEVVELLLEHGANINHINKQKRTPLVMTSIAGHAEIVRILLEQDGADVKKADVNIADKDNHTPLHIACHEGHKEIVELLLEFRADVTLTNEKGCTPLAMACIGGHAKIVELLLNQDGVDINVTDSLKNTPLGNACLRGHTEIAELLLKQDGVVINNTNIQKRTALGMACIEGYTEIVKLLLEHGANVNVTDNNGFTPLCNASIPGHTEIVELLLEHGVKNVDHTDKDNDTPLGMACIKGKKEVVELLLKHGANVNHTNKQKCTPLVLACIGGHAEIVELLKENGGVDINDTDGQNNTPLAVACIGGRKEVVEMLLNIGAKVNATDEQKRAPLSIACEQGYKEIAEVLLKHGADINVTDINENTPLGNACLEGHTEIVELLLKHGIDNTKNTMSEKNCTLKLPMARARGQPEGFNINHTNEENDTPLGIACCKGHTEIVKLLLKHEANVNVTNNNGNTALLIACKEGYTEIVELLLEQKNADVTICNEDGLNALDIAVEEGKKDAAMAIVNSNKWKNALRSYTEVDTSAGADKVCGIKRICCCKNDDANKQFTTPMRRIIKKMPDVARAVFEKCCDKKNPPDHPDYEITFNYEFLDDFDKIWTQQSKYSSENHCLNILANSPSADLLKHPLAATLLHQKWNKIGRIVYYTNLFFYFLFVILLTSYALTVHPPNSNICMEVFGNDNETSVDCFTEERFVSQRYISIVSVCLIIYSAIMIIREAFQLVLFQEEYLTSPVNYIEVPLFIFTIIFASVHGNQCYCTHSWQWQVGVIAVFLSWIALIFSIRKLPVVGIYVLMFIKIFENFVKVVVLALLLILAFAVPFYMMFYDPQDRAEGIRTPFITPWRTTVKAITMTVGELDMDSILRQNNQMNAPDVQYPVVAFSLVIVFVILMPILFLNLLIGLAVGDTDEIQKSADTYRLSLRVEFTLPIEQLLRSFRSYIDEKGCLKRVSSLLGKIVAVTNTDKPNKHNFLKQKIDEIEKSIKTEPPATLADVKNQSKSLSDEMKSLHGSVSRDVKELRSLVAQLLTTVNSLNERGGGGGGLGGEGGGGGGTGGGTMGGLEEESNSA